jgi:hypothetical protein
MALSDRFKDIRGKAEDAVLERKDQIEQAVQKAGDLADQRTGGKYHDKIEKAGGRALGYVDSLGDGERGAAAQGTAPSGPEQAEPDASEEPPPAA